MQAMSILLTVVLAPLAGSLIAGLFGKFIGRRATHSVAILGLSISTLAAIYVFQQMVSGQWQIINETLYIWAQSGALQFQVGFLIDNLTAVMMVVVTFVSLMVHIYTVGYMHDDPGYQRFFCYISLFTFAMLMLVMANNFMQLFFGWEAVGLVSYLLIGFWFKKDTAIYANLKAFLVNRVGDLGFLLGIACVLTYFGSLDYAVVFALAPTVAANDSGIQIWGDQSWSIMSVTCILLFIGAMGKSAQVPLHVWLPDSMEGPTPISALIHAATMVTAGVFMVARMSPLFEWSETALTVVLIIGSITALSMGFLGLVQNDIKRVIAYSTLSQLGYMVVALGASAYAAGIFHLMTHAFFKALLFLAAGSVIIAMHHKQDIQEMGGLHKYLPITWVTALLGSLALIGAPGFSGFYSKDAIIEAVHHSTIPGSGFAYFAVLCGVFITALYSFRLFFLVFHGQPRMDENTKAHLHEPAWVVWLPLVILAIPSVGIAWYWTEPMLFGDFFQQAIFVLPEHQVLAPLAGQYHGPLAFALHALTTLPFLLALSGVICAWLLFIERPQWVGQLKQGFSFIQQVLINKYYFDQFNQQVLARFTLSSAHALWKKGDQTVIDGWIIHGMSKSINVLAQKIRLIQTGYLYHYAFAMIVGLLGLLGMVMFGWAGANLPVSVTG